MTRRKLIPAVWYCKYCYQRQPIDIGPDGSLIICTVCEYGLAPLEDVVAAGSMRTWHEGICDAFYRRLEADPAFMAWLQRRDEVPARRPDSGDD